jgi:hypothetical protein
MKKQWIDEKLRLLSTVIADFHTRPQNFFFEPTQRVYEKLESGNDEDLQVIASQIAKHIGIVPTPITKYDWGIKMGLETAGRFSITRSLKAIQIPFFYVGKKYTIGAILAHEITHAFLAYRGIILKNSNENEMFTDLTTIYIGLGKLILNGCIARENQFNNSEDEFCMLGYLAPQLYAYGYRAICSKNLIDNNSILENLNPIAKRLIADH